ncbi:hypothetical protein ACFQL1_15170 [Halomicroarcula sp. GCM10025709]|uniref:DUF7266 family protein n=1 Tax=Halomicroarcula sp. GCM10025709 TaxID=3252669 RepID=UPI00360DFD34
MSRHDRPCDLLDAQLRAEHRYRLPAGHRAVVLGDQLRRGTANAGRPLELRVIGEQINADLQRADRLVVAGDGPAGATTVRIEQSFPDRLTGRTYDIEVDPASQQLRLSMRNPDIEVTLPVDTRTALSPSTVDGGPSRSGRPAAAPWR